MSLLITVMMLIGAPSGTVLYHQGTLEEITAGMRVSTAAPADATDWRICSRGEKIVEQTRIRGAGIVRLGDFAIIELLPAADGLQDAEIMIDQLRRARADSVKDIAKITLVKGAIRASVVQGRKVDFTVGAHAVRNASVIRAGAAPIPLSDTRALLRLDGFLATGERDFPIPGGDPIAISPAGLILSTNGETSASFRGRSLSFSGRAVRVVFSDLPTAEDILLDAGEASFDHTYEGLRLRGSVKAQSGMITFTSLHVEFQSELALEVYKIPAVLVTESGAGEFEITVTPGEEVDVE